VAAAKHGLPFNMTFRRGRNWWSTGHSPHEEAPVLHARLPALVRHAQPGRCPEGLAAKTPVQMLWSRRQSATSPSREKASQCAPESCRVPSASFQDPMACHQDSARTWVTKTAVRLGLANGVTRVIGLECRDPSHVTERPAVASGPQQARGRLLDQTRDRQGAHRRLPGRGMTRSRVSG
jgi:hypothetical protein